MNELRMLAALGTILGLVAGITFVLLRIASYRRRIESLFLRTALCVDHNNFMGRDDPRATNVNHLIPNDATIILKLEEFGSEHRDRGKLIDEARKYSITLFGGEFLQWGALAVLSQVAIGTPMLLALLEVEGFEKFVLSLGKVGIILGFWIGIIFLTITVLVLVRYIKFVHDAEAIKEVAERCPVWAIAATGAPNSPLILGADDPHYKALP